VKNQKWLMLVIALILIGGTAGALTRLKKNQRLGQPGIMAAAIPGSVMMEINLPERVLDFTSTNVPEPQVVLDYLPKDTSYAERCYQNAGGPPIFNTVILMGADRTSIHRPEYCLPGQGWQIDKKTEERIPVGGAQNYELPVMKWNVSNSYQTPDGHKVEVGGVFVFWLVSANEQSTGNVKFQCYLLRDLLLTGVLQRWAYVSYFSACAPGQEDAAFARMEKLIAASVPEFQLPPKSAGATAAVAPR
jgi:hypothetical protein